MGLKFGAAYAHSQRYKRAMPFDIWDLDEVRIVIHDKPHWLWRAVVQDRPVRKETLQKRRDTKAAS